MSDKLQFVVAPAVVLCNLDKLKFVGHLRSRRYFAPSNSTSKISVALGGITGGLPLAP